MPRRRSVLAGIVAMLVVLIAPLSVIALLDDPDPELRVVASWDRSSVLIVDGSARVLVINTDDRERARSLTGRLSRPWEPGPQMLIAPAEDGAAIGLWETLRRTEPSSVVIVGIPGALPLWSAIEHECRLRGIDHHYITGRASVATTRLIIGIEAPPPDESGDRVVSVDRDGLRVAIALDGSLTWTDASVVIGRPGTEALPDLIVTGDQSTRAALTHEVAVRSREIVRVSLSSSSVRVFGGALRVPVVGATQ